MAVLKATICYLDVRKNRKVVRATTEPELNRSNSCIRMRQGLGPVDNLCRDTNTTVLIKVVITPQIRSIIHAGINS